MRLFVLIFARKILPIFVREKNEFFYNNTCLKDFIQEEAKS